MIISPQSLDTNLSQLLAEVKSQMKSYQNLLKAKGITQSMSRKATCLDNAVAENFFGLLRRSEEVIQIGKKTIKFKEIGRAHV